jgi:hypothetical protein
MAAMEKVTYQPLIAHLQQNEELYNQIYLDYTLKHGTIDKNLVSKWIVQVVEPIVRETANHSQESLPNVSKAFYTELLQLLGSGLALTFEKEYMQLWGLCNRIPSIVSRAPSKVLKAFNNALLSIRTYQPSKTFTWIELMHSAIGSCISLDDLLNCGRICAWFCGLAHLREKCKGLLPNLSAELKNKLEEYCPVSQPLEEIFSQLWIQKNSPEFIEGAGGFAGFGGSFMQPPMLAEAGNYVLAGDKENTYLLFADAFGRVLLPCDSANFNASTNLRLLKEFKKTYVNKIGDYDDVSSCVVKNNTLFFTRQSSHYIFIYGWSDGN